MTRRPDSSAASSPPGGRSASLLGGAEADPTIHGAAAITPPRRLSSFRVVAPAAVWTRIFLGFLFPRHRVVYGPPEAPPRWTNVARRARTRMGASRYRARCRLDRTHSHVRHPIRSCARPAGRQADRSRGTRRVGRSGIRPGARVAGPGRCPWDQAGRRDHDRSAGPGRAPWPGRGGTRPGAGPGRAPRGGGTAPRGAVGAKAAPSPRPRSRPTLSAEPAHLAP